MKLKYIILALFALCSLSIFADNAKTVQGTYTFYGESSHSPAQARTLALEGARNAALASVFGTNVGQNVWTHSTRNSEAFDILSSTEVRGEWLEDLEEPKYDTQLDNDGSLTVTCTVKGLARPISNQAAEFTALALRNGIRQQFQDASFRGGDRFYLHFQAPMDGYVAVYLACPDNNVYTLLPYLGTSSGEIKVKGHREYTFFTPDNKLDLLYGPADEMVFDPPQTDVELNRLYVIFSPKPFTKALDSDNGDLRPRSLSFAEFNKWISKSRRNDPGMGMKLINIEIKQ